MSAHQETHFDPSAPFVDAWGVKYADFAARLKGKPLRCPQNRRVEGLRNLGYSQAYCRAFAKAYEAQGGETYEVGNVVDRWHEVNRRIDVAQRAAFAADRT